MMKCMGKSLRGEILVLCISFVYSISMVWPDLILEQSISLTDPKDRVPRACPWVSKDHFPYEGDRSQIFEGVRYANPAG